MAKVKKQRSCMGLLLRAVIIIVIIAAVLLGGFWAFFQFGYGINVFDVIGKLQALNSKVDDTKLLNYDKDADLAAFADVFNASGLNWGSYFDNNFEVDTTGGTDYGTLTSDLKITGPQMAAFINSYLSSAAGQAAELQGESLSDMGLELWCINFGEVADNVNPITGETHQTMVLNVVFSIDLSFLKDQFNVFPLTLFNGLIPAKLYINSTTVIEKTGALTDSGDIYTVSSQSVRINNLSANDTLSAAGIINKFTAFDIEDLNTQIGQMFADLIIGGSGTSGTAGGGFAYSLVPVGAADFAFEQDGGGSYLVVKI